MVNARDAVQVLREQAARCRRLAARVRDAAVARKLLELAVELEERADAEEARDRDR